jgi:hypothetical protein
MNFFDILSAALSILGVYTLVIYAPYLLPRNLVPHVSAALSEVKGLLDQAEANGAITDDASEYRANLTMYDGLPVVVVSSRHSLTVRFRRLAHQLQRMRAETQRYPGIYQQLVLTVRSCMTYKLYTLSSQVEDMKIKVEVRWYTLFN